MNTPEPAASEIEAMPAVSIRARRRNADGTISIGAPDTEPEDDPSVARLRTVINMMIEGKTQGQMAEHFGRSTRTIRRWAARARELRISTLESLTPYDLLSQTFARHRLMEIKLHALMARAEENGEYRAAVECVQQLRSLEKDRYIIAEKAKLFEGFRFYQPPNDDDQTNGLGVVIETVRKMAEGDTSDFVFEAAPDPEETWRGDEPLF